MPVQSIKSEAQYKEIVGASGLTAIQFIAPWDEASKTLAPKFDGYSSSKNFSNVKFYKVDINDYEDIGMASGVKNHTFRFLKDGQVKAEFKGDNYAALEASWCSSIWIDCDYLDVLTATTFGFCSAPSPASPRIKPE